MLATRVAMNASAATSAFSQLTMMCLTSNKSATMALLGGLDCRAEIQRTFAAELNIHFPGLDGLARPSVMASSKLVVCMVCGFGEFQLEETEVLELIEGIQAR